MGVPHLNIRPPSGRYSIFSKVFTIQNGQGGVAPAMRPSNLGLDAESMQAPVVPVFVTLQPPVPQATSGKLDNV